MEDKAIAAQRKIIVAQVQYLFNTTFKVQTYEICYPDTDEIYYALASHLKDYFLCKFPDSDMETETSDTAQAIYSTCKAEVKMTHSLSLTERHLFLKLF